ncbi:hypothetical protein RHSIM_Rhsim01G0159000 [Rhododendron simsii]|uniref:ATG8-interacting protein 1 n=1 Tax=Rhododendron simsii TaxID=118357 RepID=A0A834HIY5_RHOSS|nr:hypothetical protein RHSIM_Rhsim01G0159000 [Rhododendron simsii]
MANNEEGEKTTSRGNEWEVVSLSASAYAAAPGPERVELNDNDKGNTVAEDEAETSRAMFMSGHFVFPPSQHENLPLEPENIEIEDIRRIDVIDPELEAEEGGRSDAKDDENWIEKELSPHSSPEFSSFHGETTKGGSPTYEEHTVIPGPVECLEGSLDSDISQLPKPAKKDKYDRSDPPGEGWWRRRACSLYAQAKEANTFWSIFVAAAVMGLVILGQHWQQERWQALKLKWQLSVNDEVGPCLI